jgi:hypothetical protein
MSYSKIRSSNTDVHFILQDEGTIPSLVQVPHGTKKQLSKMVSEKGMTPMGVWNSVFTGTPYALPSLNGIEILLLNNGGIIGLKLDEVIDIRLSLTYPSA